MANDPRPQLWLDSRDYYWANDNPTRNEHIQIIIGGTAYLMETASRQATVGAEPVVEESTMGLMTTLEIM